MKDSSDYEGKWEPISIVPFNVLFASFSKYQIYRHLFIEMCLY